MRPSLPPTKAHHKWRLWLVNLRRISKIDGAKRHLPHRNYGQPVDLGKIRSNLTLTSLIAQDSAELAHFCGIDPSIRHRIDEERCQGHGSAVPADANRGSAGQKRGCSRAPTPPKPCFGSAVTGALTMLARPHPVFGDWCYCQPGDSQRLLDRQLSCRDKALEEDPTSAVCHLSLSSGAKPAGCHKPWTITTATRQRPISPLALKISNLQGRLKTVLAACLMNVITDSAAPLAAERIDNVVLGDGQRS